MENNCFFQVELRDNYGIIFEGDMALHDLRSCLLFHFQDFNINIPDIIEKAEKNKMYACWCGRIGIGFNIKQFS
jgi:hypothetical protein